MQKNIPFTMYLPPYSMCLAPGMHQAPFSTSIMV